MSRPSAQHTRDAEVLAAPGIDPLGDSVIQGNQTRALLLATDDHARISSAERGMAAFLEAQILDKDIQQKELRSILAEDQSGENETLKRLKDMQRQASSAAQRLSAVSYDRLRDLHASGLMLSDIAIDLDVNFNDLLAFMRQHPDSERHAVEDAESCADAQTALLLHDIENEKKPTATKVDLLKIRSNVQIEMNKRLSGKWAQRKDDDRPSHVTNQSQFNVFLNSGGKQVKYNPHADSVLEHDPSVKRKTVNYGEQGPLEPQVVSTEQPDTDQMPVAMDSAQQVRTAFSDQGVSLSFGTGQTRSAPPMPPGRNTAQRRLVEDYPEELLDHSHEKVSPPTTASVPRK